MRLPAFSSSCLVKRLPSFRKVHGILKGLGYKTQLNPLQKRDREEEGEKQSVRCYRATGREQRAQMKIANWLNSCSCEAGTERNDTWQTLTARANQEEQNVDYDNAWRQRIRWYQQGRGHSPKKALVLQLFNTDMGSFCFTINCILTTEIYCNGSKCCLLLY